jgi:hypothetical protein
VSPIGAPLGTSFDAHLKRGVSQGNYAWCHKLRYGVIAVTARVLSPVIVQAATERLPRCIVDLSERFRSKDCADDDQDDAADPFQMRPQR